MAPFTSILKTTWSSNLAQRDDDDEVVRGGSDKNLSKSKKSKNTKFGIQTHIGATREPIFLTPGAKKAFNQLRQVFIKAPILWHFDPECHIRIETNTLSYTISGVLSQLTFDQVTLDFESILTKSDFGPSLALGQVQSYLSKESWWL